MNRRADDHFGLCPHCKGAAEPDTCEIGNMLWLYCEEHKVKWCPGNFGCESEVMESQEHKKKLLTSFAEVTPYHYPEADPDYISPENIERQARATQEGYKAWYESLPPEQKAEHDIYLLKTFGPSVLGE